MSEPNAFTRFINQTEMVSLSALIRAIGWFVTVIVFDLTARNLLLASDEKLVSVGFQLALAVLGGLGFASSVGAFNTRTVRHTAREYVEAKARGAGKQNGYAEGARDGHEWAHTRQDDERGP